MKENNPKPTKLFVLGMMFFIFNFAQVTAIFAPVPLVVAALAFDRKKSYSLGLMVLGALYVCSAYLFGNLSPFATGVYTFFVGIMVSECFLRGFHPMKSILILGMLILTTAGSLSGLAVSQGFSFSKYIEESLVTTKTMLESNKEFKKEDMERLNLVEFLGNPKESASLVLKKLPLYFIGFVFLSLWGIFYFILRSYHFFSRPEYLKYSEEVLKNFKMSDYFIFPVALCLGLLLYGEKLGANYPYIGEVGLFLMGIFYFMQGFGIAMTYFDNMGIKGIFRTIILMVLLIIAPLFLCSLGLFDTWFDFRKKNKKNIRKSS